jgi:putative colanic acid biosynthesis UDP-glucose lipid carrier transferase
MSYSQLNSRSAVLSASEPSQVFVIKTLLYPAVSVLMLFLCLFATDNPLRGPYFLVAVLAFAGAADFLEVAPLDERSRSLAFNSLLDITIRWIVVVGFIWALLRVSGLAMEVSSKVFVLWALATPLAIWSVQLSMQWLLPRFGIRYMQPRRAVIVGITEHGMRLADSIRQQALLRTEVHGYFDDRAPQRMLDSGKVRMLGRTSEVADYVHRNKIDLVYITLPMTRHPRVTALLDALRDCTASIYFVPDLLPFNAVQPRFDLLNGTPVVAVCESPFYGVRGLAKRLFDIVLAGTALVLISPIMLAVAIGVRLDSGGPIIFKQKRYGLDGKEIVVYKFRSMKVTEDGDKSYTQVTRGDARVTPFGALIRKLSLDELPQLFNVLEGSMSIVGPRPHAIAVNEQYRKLIPGYMVRHKVKPGITGWAQVNGYRGGDDIDSMSKRIAYDLEYLRHWSLRLDLMIMIRTATLVWNDSRAF